MRYLKDILESKKRKSKPKDITKSSIICFEYNRKDHYKNEYPKLNKQEEKHEEEDTKSNIGR